jgi:hypothetical protein
MATDYSRTIIHLPIRSPPIDQEEGGPLLGVEHEEEGNLDETVWLLYLLFLIDFPCSLAEGGGRADGNGP